MSDSLFTDQDNINSRNSYSKSTPLLTEDNEEEEEETEQKQKTVSSRLALTENNSFLIMLNRICFYWGQVLLHKIRVAFTFMFMSMLNITARIIYFIRRNTSSPSSSLNTTISSSSIQTLKEDLSDSSKSFLFTVKEHKEGIDFSSLRNSTMAHISVQQRTHRTPNINIHQSRSLQKDTSLHVTHSVDESLFLHNSRQLLHVLTPFASDPCISKHHKHLTTSHEGSGDFISTSPTFKSCLQLNDSKNNEIHFDEIFDLNCEKIQPVSTSSKQNLHNDEIDNRTSTANSSTEQVTKIDDKFKNQQLNENLLYDASRSLSIGDNSVRSERRFRRRKKRSTYAKDSISFEDTQSTIDLLEKFDINDQEPQEINENLEAKQDDDECNQTNGDIEKSAPVSRYRGRKLRRKFYRHAAASSSSQEVTVNIPLELYLPNEALNVETPKVLLPIQSLPITVSSDASTVTIPLLPPETSSVTIPLPADTTTVTAAIVPSDVSNVTVPALSSDELTLTVSSNQASRKVLASVLKRIGSAAATKKSVRFADSVGRELTQTQYFGTSVNDESNDLSILLSSSLLASSRSSKRNVPNISHVDHELQTFNVSSTQNRSSNEILLPKKFFCLFRQPVSGHPDIYLHEIWKSQVKLEHVNITHSRTSGEQQLFGTLWVTNLNYCKYVSIKYTFNRWLNIYERGAQHCRYSSDFRNIDQFQFTVDIPADVDRIDFVLRYCVNEQEYWDNNEGKNYTLQTESAYILSTTISLPNDCDFNEVRFY